MDAEGRRLCKGLAKDYTNDRGQEQGQRAKDFYFIFLAVRAYDARRRRLWGGGDAREVHIEGVFFCWGYVGWEKRAARKREDCRGKVSVLFCYSLRYAMGGYGREDSSAERACNRPTGRCLCWAR